MSARSIVRCPFAILAFPNALHYFRPIRQTTGFYGEDYSMWSDKIRHHLTSHHKSIWDIVEYGAQVPKKGDKDYDSEEVDQIRHFNSQATTILLASLSREEYNKVQGLKSAKEIWDVLKTAHEGDEVTKITKRETIEGELGRFMLNQGEEPQAVQPAQDLGEPSAQPREHKTG
jgi:hypothetical protein